jgi:cysteine-rich repeat protein
VEECQTGSCVSPGDPCQSDEICNEADNQCDALCGNGSLDGAEDCDDANDTDSDGCTDCSIDPGFDCMTNVSPSVCVESPDAGHDHDHGHDAGIVGDGDAATAGDGDDSIGAEDASASGGDGDDGPGNGNGAGDEDASIGDGGSVTANGTEEDSTCNCRFPRSSSHRPALPLLLLAGALWLRRRAASRVARGYRRVAGSACSERDYQ